MVGSRTAKFLKHGRLSVAEKRRFARVGMQGPIRWTSGDNSGECEILNMSPVGAALQVQPGSTFRMGPDVALHMQLDDGLEWFVTENAKVVRKILCPDGTYEVCVEFDQDEPEKQNRSA